MIESGSIIKKKLFKISGAQIALYPLNNKKPTKIHIGTITISIDDETGVRFFYKTPNLLVPVDEPPDLFHFTP